MDEPRRYEPDDDSKLDYSGHCEIDATNLNAAPKDGPTSIVNKLSSYLTDNRRYDMKPIPVRSFHVSCISDRPEKIKGSEEYTGIVLYAKWDSAKQKWKPEWEQNGRETKAGYIIIIKSDKVKAIERQNDPGQVHGALFRYVFNEVLEPKNYVASGFGRVGGEWKFNSYTLNTDKNFRTTSKKAMDDFEMHHIQTVIKKWIEQGEWTVYLEEEAYVNYVKKIERFARTSALI